MPAAEEDGGIDTDWIAELQRLVQLPDVLPIRPIPQPPSWGSRSRRCRARRARAHELWWHAEGARYATNQLGTSAPSEQMRAPEPRRVASRGHTTREEEIWTFLLKVSQTHLRVRRGVALSLPTGASRLSQFITSVTPQPYGDIAQTSAYVPFIGLKIAEPALGAHVVDMLEALPPDISRLYERVEDLLLPEEEQPPDQLGLSRRYHKV